MSAQPQPALAPVAPRHASPLRRRWLWGVAGLLAAAALSVGVWRRLQPAAKVSLPVFRIGYGAVRVVLYAHGTLGGQNPDLLAAPGIGGGQLYLSYLLPDGTRVQPGEVVARFSAAQQQYQLLQAENDVAQAQANIASARDAMLAQAEEDSYALLDARDQVRLAELEVRRNPILAALDARANLLKLSAAQAQLRQLKSNLAGERQSGLAQIRIQEAAEHEAQLKVDLARHNIGAMELRAHRAGYFSIQPNPHNQYFYYPGMTFPRYHLGDQVYPGNLVAEIPDLSQLRLNATMGEANRAYLAAGEQAVISVIALPGRSIAARVINVGGVTGRPWNRRFHCTLALLNKVSGLRPGMSAEARITVKNLPHALWAPTEAVFGASGAAYVYVRRQGRFVRQPVKVLLRSESRVALAGVKAGDTIALINPQTAVNGKEEKS